MALTQKQRGVLGGIIPALAVTLLGFGGGIWLWPQNLLPADDIGARLAFVLSWDSLVVVWLALTIGKLARHRFFSESDIDGSGLTSGTDQTKVHQAVLQNTLEQVVLALTVHLGAAVLLPLLWLACLPVAAILFCVGRVLFWRGYRAGAPARAVGFGLTFYPSIILLLITFSHFIISI